MWYLSPGFIWKFAGFLKHKWSQISSNQFKICSVQLHMFSEAAKSWVLRNLIGFSSFAFSVSAALCFFYCQKFRTVPFLPFASLKNLFSVIRIPLKSASDSQNSPSDVSNTNYPCPFFTRNWPEKVWKTKIIGLTSLLKFHKFNQTG